MCLKSPKNIGVTAHDADALITDEILSLRTLFQVKSTKSAFREDFCWKSPQKVSGGICLHRKALKHFLINSFGSPKLHHVFEVPKKYWGHCTWCGCSNYRRNFVATDTFSGKIHKISFQRGFLLKITSKSVWKHLSSQKGFKTFFDQFFRGPQTSSCVWSPQKILGSLHMMRML